MTAQNDSSLIPRTKISRGFKTAVALFLLILLIIIIIIIYPILPTTPAWMIQLQLNVYSALGRISPYILVGLLGGTVGVAELVSTFQTYPREALRTRWAWVLIVVNVVAAMIALVVVRVTMPEMNTILQVLSVGVGFQALIRTRFVLAKQVGAAGSEGEIAVNLGWVYDQFQNLARTQIDLELMNNRRTAVTRLVEYYPSLAELYDIAWYTITARATLTVEEEAARKEELEKLLDPKAPENYAKTSMALAILENGGQAYVELLLDQAMETHEPEAAARQIPSSPEKLARQLVDRFSLNELVAMTEELCESENARDYAREAAKPDPNASRTNQKATVAHFLIQQAGIDAVRQKLQQS